MRIREPDTDGLIRFLDPDGNVMDPEALCGLEIKKDVPLLLYRKMVSARKLHEIGNAEGHTDRMTIFIGPLGQEAVMAVVFALGPEVGIDPYGRSWHVELARGVSEKSILDGFFANPLVASLQDFIDRIARPPYVAVGAQIPRAVGAAWAPKILANKIIPVATFFGDAATAQGDFHGAMSHAKIHNIPVLFFCENNQWAISTPLKLNCPTPTIADRAKGYGIPAIRVDGNDPFACYWAGTWAYKRALEHSESSFTELVLPTRLGEHTTAVGELIKIPKEELDEAWRKEPLRRMKGFLISDAAKEIFGIEWSEEDDQKLHEETRERIKKLAQQSFAEFLEAKKGGKALIQQTVEWLKTPRVGKRFQTLAKAGVRAKTVSKAGARDAIGIAAFDAMCADPSVVWIGQDVARGGGVNRTSAVPKHFIAEEPAVKKILPDAEQYVLHQYLPLVHLFPNRLWDMQLNEALIAAVGLGLATGDGKNHRARPIIEVQFSGFVRYMLHHIEEHSRHQFRNVNLDLTPGVYFLPSGTGERIEFHRDVELSLFTNNPALIIAFPRTPQDYYDMFFAAIASDKPVIFFAHLDLYREPKTELKRKPPLIPIEEFRPQKIAEGNDITVVSYGKMVYACLKAMERTSALAEKKQGGAPINKTEISADIFDLRLIKPLHTDEIAESFKKTGRFLYVQEEPASFGTGAELIRRLEKEAFLYGQAPKEVLAPPDTFTPPTKFWDDYIPQPDEIAEKIIEIVNF